jgi:hypothetical protein
VLNWFAFREAGMKSSPHAGHLMCSKSMGQRFSGGIEYPHFVQVVLSDASTLARLIFCLRGIIILSTLNDC